jgi:2-amino-4-hydroxy-6-hydroxymethyldihydropteridine diphosphokinase
LKLSAAVPPELPQHTPCPETPRRRLREKPYRLAFIGLGSNIAPEENLAKAVELLCEQASIQSLSTAWETPPLGLKGANFINAAAAVQTQLSASLLKSLVLRPIEIQLGRVRTLNKYAPRTIDLDILIYDERLIDPHLWEFFFLAAPLAELIPDYPHPQIGETLAQAAQRLAESTPARPRPEVLAQRARRLKGQGRASVE